MTPTDQAALLRAAIRATKHGRHTLNPADLRVLDALLDLCPHDHPTAVTLDTIAAAACTRPEHASKAVRHLERRGLLARGRTERGAITYHLTPPTLHDTARQAAA